MTYPNQPAGYPPPPGYPPQQPPQQGYYPQQAPYAPGPPQGYGPPPQQGYYQQQAPPPPVLARGTLEDYLDQPTGGGGAATSKFFTPQRMNGHWIQVQIARDINNSDVRQQTDKFGTPLTFKSNNKPKFQVLVPCTMLNSSEPQTTVTLFADGVTVFLKGVVGDSFKSAMRAAGITDPDRAIALGQLGGASFYMISAGTKQFGQGNPTNMFDFRYTPNGRELAGAPVQAEQALPPTTLPAQTVAATPAPASALPQLPGPAAYAPQQTAPAPGMISAEQQAYYQATGQLPPVPQPGLPPAVPSPGAPAAPPAVAPPPAAVAPPAVPQAPPGYAPQAAPVPPGYAPAPPQGPPAPPQAPGNPNLTPEQAATLARLQGQQG